MKKEDFVQKKCNSGKNIQFAPKGYVKLNLEKVAPSLEELGATIEIETKSLLIFRLEGTQVDLNSNGKTIVKTENKEKAEGVFSEMFSSLLFGLP